MQDWDVWLAGGGLGGWVGGEGCTRHLWAWLHGNEIEIHFLWAVGLVGTVQPASVGRQLVAKPGPHASNQLPNPPWPE